MNHEFLSFPEIHRLYVAVTEGNPDEEVPPLKQREIAEALGITPRAVRYMKAGDPRFVHQMIRFIEMRWPGSSGSQTKWPQPEFERDEQDKLVTYYRVDWTEDCASWVGGGSASTPDAVNSPNNTKK